MRKSRRSYYMLIQLRDVLACVAFLIMLPLIFLWLALEEVSWHLWRANVKMLI